MRAPIVCVLALSLVACSDGEGEESTALETADGAEYAGDEEGVDLAADLQNAVPGDLVHKGRGLLVEIIEQGFGQAVQAGDHVDVHFRGFLKATGEEFDSSYSQGKPAHVELGTGQVIPGWERGLEDLQVGCKAKLHVPSFLAYGQRGFQDVIPPNADLIFEIEVLKIYGPEEAH